MIRRLIGLLTVCIAFLAGMTFQHRQAISAQEQKIYELRTYTTAPGRLSPLLNRFDGGEIDLFHKHGMTSIGYWVPDHEDLSQNTLVYMVAHDDRNSAEESWTNFSADPVWTQMWNKSLEDGPIVIGVEVQFLNPTTFSPLH
ncbi:MAG: NIPSNAP family protein [Gammaproteobacteria bacterium]|nr:NIPSNAP family protein [Gammaproteobacteria bacterium]